MEVEGRVYGDLQLTLLDLTGRTVKTVQAHHTNQLKVDRAGLTTGLHLYRMKGEGQILHQGKVMFR